MVFKTRWFDHDLHNSLTYLHIPVLEVKKNCLVNDSRLTRLDHKIQSGFQNHVCDSRIYSKKEQRHADKIVCKK